MESIRSFFKREEKSTDAVGLYFKEKHAAKIGIQSSDRDGLRRKK